jgi:hypothetical protein
MRGGVVSQLIVVCRGDGNITKSANCVMKACKPGIAHLALNEKQEVRVCCFGFPTVRKARDTCTSLIGQELPSIDIKVFNWSSVDEDRTIYIRSSYWPVLFVGMRSV